MIEQGGIVQGKGSNEGGVTTKYQMIEQGGIEVTGKYVGKQEINGPHARNLFILDRRGCPIPYICVLQLVNE